MKNKKVETKTKLRKEEKQEQTNKLHKMQRKSTHNAFTLIGTNFNFGQKFWALKHSKRTTTSSQRFSRSTNQ